MKAPVVLTRVVRVRTKCAVVYWAVWIAATVGAAILWG